MEIGSPHYEYEFHAFKASGGGGWATTPSDLYPAQNGGVVSFEEEIEQFTDNVPDREVFAGLGALPFGVAVTTLSTLPDPPSGTPVGTDGSLEISQSFRKDRADASLSFTITEAKLVGLDSSPAGDILSVDVGLLVEVEAYFVDPFNPFTSLLLEATLNGLGRANPGPGLCSPPCWALDTDGLPLAVSVGGLDQGYVEIGLTAPLTRQVEISDVPVGAEFTLVYYAYAWAVDTAQVDTGGSARFRDPLNPDSGTYFEFSGLTPTDNPVLAPEPGRPALLLAGAAILLALRSARRRRPHEPLLARRLAHLRSFPITRA